MSLIKNFFTGQTVSQYDMDSYFNDMYNRFLVESSVLPVIYSGLTVTSTGGLGVTVTAGVCRGQDIDFTGLNIPNTTTPTKVELLTTSPTIAIPANSTGWIVINVNIVPAPGTNNLEYVVSVWNGSLNLPQFVTSLQPSPGSTYPYTQIVLANVTSNSSIATVTLTNRSFSFPTVWATIQNLPAFPALPNTANGVYDYKILQNGTSFTAKKAAGKVYARATNYVDTDLEVACDGSIYPLARYYNLAQWLLTNTGGISWGIAPQSFTTGVATSTVTATANINGAVTSATDGTTGFTVTQTNAGSGGAPAVFTVAVNSTGAGLAGTYFNYYATTTQFYCWLSLNDASVDPAIPGAQGVKVIFTGTETQAQLAQLIATQIQISQFVVPTTQGLFIRGWANGSAFDPDRSTRTAITTGGAVGDSVGSYQANQNLSHNHTIPSQNQGFNASVGYACGSNIGPTTGPIQSTYSGGNQSNPNNVNMYYVITY